MSSTVLVINSGSSSLKFALLDPARPQALASGLVERIGEQAGRLKASFAAEGVDDIVADMPIPDHAQAFAVVQQALDDSGVLAAEQLVAVGHRVVHGGERFSEPTVIDEDVIEAIEDVVPLAPLHNPANLLGIRGAMAAFPHLPQVAVFDTAFHATMPAAAYTYAIDQEIAAAHALRRYGFHGTSHKYVTEAAARHLGIAVDSVDLVSLHLGNGASACAIKGGASVETSMGVGPLEGLVMGTRSGDIDATVVFTLLNAGLSVDEVDTLLNRGSGMKGLCGDNDLRAVGRRADEGDADAELAREVYVHRIRKYLGAYLAVLGRADAIVFTAGVGENDAWVREQVCAGLAMFGVAIDPNANEAVFRPSRIADIHAPGSPVAVLVVPTNEELEIALQALAVLAR